MFACKFSGMQNVERDLAKRIEQVICSFLMESRAAAAAAVDKSFSAASTQAKAAPKKRAKLPSVKRAPADRRTTSQINELRERFYQTIVTCPGETMRTLSAQLGEDPIVLYRHAVRLRKQGLIKTVGILQSMRYFPMVGAAKTETPRV